MCRSSHQNGNEFDESTCFPLRYYTTFLFNFIWRRMDKMKTAIVLLYIAFMDLFSGNFYVTGTEHFAYTCYMHNYKKKHTIER